MSFAHSLLFYINMSEANKSEKQQKFPFAVGAWGFRGAVSDVNAERKRAEG